MAKTETVTVDDSNSQVDSVGQSNGEIEEMIAVPIDRTKMRMVAKDRWAIGFEFSHDSLQLSYLNACSAVRTVI